MCVCGDANVVLLIFLSSFRPAWLRAVGLHGASKSIKCNWSGSQSGSVETEELRNSLEETEKRTPGEFNQVHFGRPP